MIDTDSLTDLIRLIRPLYKELEAAVTRGLEGIGLTVIERAVLEQIHVHGPLPVPRIADALIAPRQFIQKTANGLMAAGLIERRLNTAHRRSMLLALTPAGAELITGVLAHEARVTARVAEAIAPGDVATARRVIEAMITGFREKETEDDR